MRWQVQAWLAELPETPPVDRIDVAEPASHEVAPFRQAHSWVTRLPVVRAHPATRPHLTTEQRVEPGLILVVLGIRLGILSLSGWIYPLRRVGGREIAQAVVRSKDFVQQREILVWRMSKIELMGEEGIG